MLKIFGTDAAKITLPNPEVANSRSSVNWLRFVLIFTLTPNRLRYRPAMHAFFHMFNSMMIEYIVCKLSLSFAVKFDSDICGHGRVCVCVFERLKFFAQEKICKMSIFKFDVEFM